MSAFWGAILGSVIGWVIVGIVCAVFGGGKNE